MIEGGIASSVRLTTASIGTDPSCASAAASAGDTSPGGIDSPHSSLLREALSCGARDEFLLAAAAQNLRKLAKLIPTPTPMPATERPAPISNSHSTGTSAGAPLFLIKNTRNFAGLVLLAFRSTT